MTRVRPTHSSRVSSSTSAKAGLLAAAALVLGLSGTESVQATTGIGPYEVPQIIDINSNPNIVETYIVADEATVNIGNGVTANAMAFKSCAALDATCTAKAGTIPGPEFRLTVGNRVIVHYVNNLNKSNLTPEANVSGIHWHGIELNNASDGTEVTQPAVGPAGGTFTYDFIVSRPGIFWYHPHHHSSTNQVAKGLYGSIIVKDNKGYEDSLISSGVIPSVVKTLVLSDITVCNPGNNPTTYADGLPHVSGISSSGLNKWQTNYSNHDLTQSPSILCDTYPLDANGKLLTTPYGAGDVPNIQSPSLTGRMSEGFTVLTNGVAVDSRGGDPSIPAAPSTSVLANAFPVQPGQGLRLQIVNPSPVRHMRLLLTDDNGVQIPLVRIGGQGGLLNKAVVEGGVVAGFDFEYGQGEILVPPAGRADVVAAIPPTASGVLTLWQEDFKRVLDTWSWTPTVPVMHLKVNGNSVPTYSISGGTSLLESIPGASVPALVALRGNLDLGSNEQGSTNPDIQLTFWANSGAFEGSIDGVPMPRDFTGLGKDGLQHSGNPFYLASARHAALSNVMELTVTNTTGAHHPFHLHGFSFQPMSLTSSTGGPSYTFLYNEFQDIVDVPAFSTLTFRVSLDDRPTIAKPAGGGLGRWLFHCHILPHATFGMMSELHVHKK